MVSFKPAPTLIDLINIDWPALFHFEMEISGEPVSIYAYLDKGEIYCDLGSHEVGYVNITKVEEAVLLEHRRIIEDIIDNQGKIDFDALHTACYISELCNELRDQVTQIYMDACYLRKSKHAQALVF